MGVELMALTPETVRRITNAVHDDRMAPDGAILEHWDCQALASSLDAECNRAGALGLPKVSLHMDLPDAHALAAALRRLALLGW
jgi:hypothetical protein